MYFKFFERNIKFLILVGFNAFLDLEQINPAVLKARSESTEVDGLEWYLAASFFNPTNLDLDQYLYMFSFSSIKSSFKYFSISASTELHCIGSL